MQPEPCPETLCRLQSVPGSPAHYCRDHPQSHTRSVVEAADSVPGEALISLTHFAWLAISLAQGLWQAMRSELDLSVPRLERYPLPQPHYEYAIGDGLYNSARDYLEQIEAYKE